MFSVVTATQLHHSLLNVGQAAFSRSLHSGSGQIQNLYLWDQEAWIAISVLMSIMTPGGPMTLACTFCGAFKALHKFSRFYPLHLPTAPYKSKKINKTITKISVHLVAQLHIGTNWNKSQLLSFQSLLRHFILTNISCNNCYKCITHIL